MVQAFKQGYQSWMYGPIFLINVEELEMSIPAWTKLTAKLSKDLKGPSQR